MVMLEGSAMNLCGDDDDNHGTYFLSFTTFSASLVSKPTCQSQTPSLQNLFSLTLFPQEA